MHLIMTMNKMPVYTYTANKWRVEHSSAKEANISESITKVGPHLEKPHTRASLKMINTCFWFKRDQKVVNHTAKQGEVLHLYSAALIARDF